MTDESIKYGFWFWSDKLVGVLTMLSYLADYKLDTPEIEYLRQELRGTNDELNKWTQYKLGGRLECIIINLAFDAEEGYDMIHIRINASANLKAKLEALSLFQSLFLKIYLLQMMKIKEKH